MKTNIVVIIANLFLIPLNTTCMYKHYVHPLHVLPQEILQRINFFLPPDTLIVKNNKKNPTKNIPTKKLALTTSLAYYFKLCKNKSDTINLPKHNNTICLLATGKESNLLALATNNHCSLYSTKKKRVIFHEKIYHTIKSILLSNDEKIIAITSHDDVKKEDTITLFDILTHTKKYSVQYQSPTSFIFNPHNNEHILVQTKATLISHKNKENHSIPLYNQSNTPLMQCTHDGTILLVKTNKYNISQYNAQTLEKSNASITTTYPATSIYCCKNNTAFILTTHNTIHIGSIHKNISSIFCRALQNLCSFTVSPNEKQLASLSKKNNIHIWDISIKDKRCVYKPVDEPMSISKSINNSIIFFNNKTLLAIIDGKCLAFTI